MKILIIRFSSIGDIVLTTPVIRCLYQQLGANIHYATKKSFANILYPNPYIAKVHILTDDWKKFIESLKYEEFDYIIDLHKNLRTFRLKCALLGTRSYSFRKLNFEKWLMVNLKKNYLPDTHIVDRYLDTVKKLGIKNDDKGLDYFIPEKEEITDSEISSILYQNLNIPIRESIACAIGAAHYTKRMPLEKWIEIAQNTSKQLFLLGGAEDSPTAEKIIEAAGRGHVWNLCGKLSLHQSASIIRQAEKVISHDTGLMHIAAAFQKPILSIWGSTIPAFGMYPYYPSGESKNISIEVANLSCRPCSKIGYNACPKKHFFCMKKVDIHRIIENI